MEGFAGELTRIRLMRQFKPFVYLNRPAAGAPNKKAPPFGGARPHSLLLTRNCSHNCSLLGSQLVVLTVLATLLAGPITLAHRVILLLLSGFLPAALLLTWLVTWALLTGVLTLLTRILVLLLRHRGELPCWTSEGK